MYLQFIFILDDITILNERVFRFLHTACGIIHAKLIYAVTVSIWIIGLQRQSYVSPLTDHISYDIEHVEGKCTPV